MGRWLPLLVRDEDYAEFVAMVRDRERDRGDAGEVPVLGWPTAPGAEPALPPAGADVATSELGRLVPWEVPDLIELASGRTVTTRRWALAMDVCADRAGEFLSTEEVASAAGMTVAQWRDAPRKISRHLARHYPQVPGWPLRGVPGRHLGHLDGQVYWAVNAEQARRWRQARDESPA